LPEKNNLVKLERKMSIQIQGSIEKHRMDARPTFMGPETVKPPPGSESAIRNVPAYFIPPINTDTNFSDLSTFTLSDHPGIAEMDVSSIPETFNWKSPQDGDSSSIKKKKQLIARPGNQALCGSCWAIAGAGMIGDNYVVSGHVDWIPNISTTWSLACMGQNKCGGGNPGQLFVAAAEKGVVSNHCVDYSWCLENENCNGSALKHFERNKQSGTKEPPKVNLSTLIPSCGCYFGEDEHYLYKIDPKPHSIFIGAHGITKDNISITVKKHVYTNGPALGGFLVFKNFMSGKFSGMNGGVYLEKGVYTGDTITFDDKQISAVNYKGAHAVVIVGWGVAKNILVDTGKRDDVPYWYVRNSWTTHWGSDGGFFKMAMYPWNKMSQFESKVSIQPTAGPVHSSGGIIFITVSKPPVKQKMPSIKTHGKLSQPDSYYKSDPKTRPSGSRSSLGIDSFVRKIPWKTVAVVAAAVVGTALLVTLGYILWKRRGKGRNRRGNGGGRGGSY
jgi:hypothetical protein